MAVVWILLRLCAALLLFRVLGLPLARLAFPRLPATAYAVASTLGLVVSGHVTWLLCHAGFRLGLVSIGLGLVATAGLSAIAAIRLRRSGARILPTLRIALVHHAVFALAFALALAITARNPGVDPDSERFMDLAMVKATLASRVLPLEDPWLAAERVAYYDYGFFSTAYLSLFSGPIDIFFNVAVALLYPALMTGALGIGRDLAGALGGLLCAFLVSVAGNLDALRQTVLHGWKIPLDWFHGARVLEGGITEFPLFALLWGDLHPYVLALPLWPILLASVAAMIAGQSSYWTAGLGAVAYAALIGTNTWDAVPIATVLLFGGLTAAWRQLGFSSLLHAISLLVMGGLFAVPFLLKLPLAGRGLVRVPAPSSMLELLGAWGAPALVLLVALVLGLARASGRLRELAPVAGLILGMGIVFAPTRGTGIAAAGALVAIAMMLLSDAEDAFAWCLAAVGAGLVAGVEVLCVNDWYSGELERMNTVFKTYVEAWVLLMVASGLLLARLTRCSPRAGVPLLVLVTCASALYPVRAIPVRAGALLEPLGLDVWLSFDQLHPQDAAAARALAAQPRGVVLETSLGPYTWGSRFATFTGYPTLVGWGHHEMGWRNVTAAISDRVAEIDAAYRAASLEPLEQLRRKYNVRWVVVGKQEREAYPAESLAKFTSLPVAISEGETTIYELGERR